MVFDPIILFVYMLENVRNVDIAVNCKLLILQGTVKTTIF